MRIKIIFSGIGFVLVSMLLSCGSKNTFENGAAAKITFDLNGEVIQSGQQTLVFDEDRPSNRYCRIDSTVTYGFGNAFYLPDSLKDCGLKLIISGKIRESSSITGYIAIAEHTFKDSLVVWEIVPATKFVKQLNTWTSFRDSLTINKGKNSMLIKSLRVFPVKALGKGFFDVDDLKIEILNQP